jgi:hypothetical protein
VSETVSRFELDATVTLQWAMEHRARVLVIVRGDPAMGRQARLLEGIPVDFSPTRDGRERVVLETVAGESQQLVLLERIARVTVEGRETIERASPEPSGVIR